MTRPLLFFRRCHWILLGVSTVYCICSDIHFYQAPHFLSSSFDKVAQDGVLLASRDFTFMTIAAVVTLLLQWSLLAWSINVTDVMNTFSPEWVHVRFSAL